MKTKDDRERLKRLRKRVAHLTERINAAPKDKPLHFDIAERSALEWAMQIIREHAWVEEHFPKVAESARSATIFDQWEREPVTTSATPEAGRERDERR